MESIANSNLAVTAAFYSYIHYKPSPEMRMIDEGHQRLIRDAQAYLETAEARGRAKGILKWLAKELAEELAKGRMKRFAKELAEGLAKGITEDEAEGKTEFKTEAALLLLKQGVDIDLIMRATGFSVREIKELIIRAARTSKPYPQTNEP